MTRADEAIVVVPANEAPWEDLQLVFGTRGAPAWCQCQRYKLRPKEAFRNFPVHERAERLRSQAGCGDPAARTSGLVAYLAGEPVLNDYFTQLFSMSFFKLPVIGKNPV